jgi:hypothetical protein
MGGTETVPFYIAMILVPAWLPVLAYGFAGLTFMSVQARISWVWKSSDVKKTIPIENSVTSLRDIAWFEALEWAGARRKKTWLR